MTPAELVAFVRGLAERPESWAHLVEHDRAARTYSELVRTDDVAAWLICWMDDHDTGFHDHDVSRGAVAVVAGRGRGDRPLLGGAPPARGGGAGGAVTVGGAGNHPAGPAGAG